MQRFAAWKSENGKDHLWLVFITFGCHFVFVSLSLSVKNPKQIRTYSVSMYCCVSCPVLCELLSATCLLWLVRAHPVGKKKQAWSKSFAFCQTFAGWCCLGKRESDREEVRCMVQGWEGWVFEPHILAEIPPPPPPPSHHLGMGIFSLVVENCLPFAEKKFQPPPKKTILWCKLMNIIHY